MGIEGVLAIGNVKSAWVEVTIRFNASAYWRQGAYVASYEVGIDGLPLASLVCTPEPNSVRLLDLNLDHPVLSIGERSVVSPGLFDDVHFFTEPGPDGPDVLAISDQSDALPEWGRVLPLDFSMDTFVGVDASVDPAEYKKRYRYEVDTRVLILSRLMVGPGQLLRTFWCALAIRRSAAGSAAEKLRTAAIARPVSLGWRIGGVGFSPCADEPFITKLNTWLSYETKLNIGYTVSHTAEQSLPTKS